MTEQNIRQLKKYKILLIGDNGIDIYQYGDVNRISPEAPVPIFIPTHKEERPGMAGNVYANLVALGCEVDIICGRSSIKTRLIDSRSKQQIIRIDNDVESIPIVNVDVENYDAVVISDYGKGVVSYELIEKIISTKIVTFIDTKKTNLSRMQGAWVKINEDEYSKLKSECTGLIVTTGANGAKVIHHDIILKPPTVEVVDITGAGDTFLASLTFKFLQTKNIKEAVKFANSAASITVQHLGCYAPTLEEIK